jgi:hypothetical protein
VVVVEDHETTGCLVLVSKLEEMGQYYNINIGIPI